MLEVRKAVIERLRRARSDRDLTFYWHVPTQVEPPAVLVMPDFPFVELEQTYSDQFARWNLVLTLVVDRIDEEVAQEQLSAWVDPSGPIIGALRDSGRCDALSRLTSDVRVTTGGDFNEMTMGGTTYYYAQLRVTIRA